jgi:hypothetical protein
MSLFELHSRKEWISKEIVRLTEELKEYSLLETDFYARTFCQHFTQSKCVACYNFSGTRQKINDLKNQYKLITKKIEETKKKQTNQKIKEKFGSST